MCEAAWATDLTQWSISQLKLVWCAPEKYSKATLNLNLEDDTLEVSAFFLLFDNDQ